MASTSNINNNEQGDDSFIHPIPTSVIVINETTPLLSKEQQLASGTKFKVESNSIFRFIKLSQDDQTKEKELRGLLLLIISSFLFACVSVIVKILGEKYSFFEIVLARAFTQLPLGLIGCYFLNINPLGKKEIRHWLFLRALASSIALFFFFYSLVKLTLVEATVVFFLGPIFKVVIGFVLLDDKFSIVDLFYSIVCFVGLLFVSQPTLLSHQFIENIEYQRSFAIVCALLGAFMSAIAYIFIRKVGQMVHVLIHTVYFGLVTILLIAPVLALDYASFKLPSSFDIILFITLGVLAFLAQYFINIGLQSAPPGPVTLVHSIDVIFAFLFGAILFKEIPGLYTIIGSLLIVFMTTAMSLHRWHRQELKIVAIKRKRSKDKLIQHQKLLNK